MPKTLLQTFLAAFCAILAHTSCMGGGGMRRRMMVAACPYQRVNYIESHRAEYIDTGIVSNVFPQVSEMDYEFVSIASGSADVLAGPGGDWSTIGSNDKFNTYTQHSSSFAYVGIGRDVGVKHHSVSTLTSSLQMISCDGTTASTSGARTNDYSIWLFCKRKYRNESIPAYMANARLYGCKISQAGTLVRDFIPVVKNGEGCLYDRVSGAFFRNLGTGAFTWG